MQISEKLASFIARAAITDPFRQTRILTTRDLITWLSDRGLRVDTTCILHLWQIGVLHPIAVLEPAVQATNNAKRFVRLELGYDLPSYVDLCCVVGEDSVTLRTAPTVPPDAVLWHSLQLWSFDRVLSSLKVNISLATALRGAESYKHVVDRLLPDMPGDLASWANSAEHAGFLKVLALMLYAEPLVHLFLDTSVQLPGWGESSLPDYQRWVNAEGSNAPAILERLSLSLNDVRGWHERIASRAELADPVAGFRVFLRHVDKRARERMRQNALEAESLYEAAEILRRYAETFHGVEWPEEDDVMAGPQSQFFKERRYGRRRTADFERRVFRRIVRSFGLDPQPRTTWYVEGETELGFARRYAERRGLNLEQQGVEVMNLRGVGGLTSDKFRDLVERHQREEVFAYVATDEDGRGDHLRHLRHYATDDLLPAGFRVWFPNFEIANFALWELAELATNIANEAGVTLLVTPAEIEGEMAKRGCAAGTALKRILRRANIPWAKGERWGRMLADWAYDRDCPSEIADDQGNRPTVTLFNMLLRGQLSDYRATVEFYEVAEDGRIVPRKGK